MDRAEQTAPGIKKYMTQQRIVWWAVLLPIAAVLIWSLNIVITRYVTEFIEPMSISFYRWVLAWLLLTPFMWQSAWQQRQLIQTHAFKLATLSAFGMLLYQGLGLLWFKQQTPIGLGGFALHHQHLLGHAHPGQYL